MKPATQQSQQMLDVLEGMSAKDLSMHPMCNTCGWRKGGLDSWNGRACKCGFSAPTFREILSEAQS